MQRRRGKTIEDRAKEVRATGSRLSAAKQALRDSLIVTRKGQGWHTEAIAAEAGVNERTVRRVLAEREALGEALLDRDPIDVVRQMATELQASVADFEAMASVRRARARRPGVRRVSRCSSPRGSPDDPGDGESDPAGGRGPRSQYRALAKADPTGGSLSRRVHRASQWGRR
ncbi:MAG TPA: hypothetical protein VGV57_06560 [Thermoleophilaceae bacterium]|nr:hypothetical protein [Thermoleophilaceae bacterium]